MPSVLVGWTANTDDTIGYEIHRALGTGPLTLLTSVGKVTTYTDTTVPNVNQDVAYGVKAFDAAGNRSGISEIKKLTVDVIPPMAPVGLEVAFI